MYLKSNKKLCDIFMEN